MAAVAAVGNALLDGNSKKTGFEGQLRVVSSPLGVWGACTDCRGGGAPSFPAKWCQARSDIECKIYEASTRIDPPSSDRFEL